MSKDADYRSTNEQITHAYTYEIIETIEPIAVAIRQITSSNIEQIAMVAITLHFGAGASSDIASPTGRVPASYTVNQATQPHPGEQRKRPTQNLLDHLRPLVRKTDKVFLLDRTLYFLLPGANQQGGEIVQTRLWEAVLWHINNVTDAAAIHLYSITIGHSAYPAPCIDIDEFIEAANEVVLCFNFHPERPVRKARRTSLSRGQTSTQVPTSTGLRITEEPASDEEDEGEELPALARKLGIPYLTLLPSKLSEDLQRLVNPQLALELGCYPIGRERNTLTVAMLNPQDRSSLERLHRETGLHIFPVLTHPRALQTALAQLIS
jgi:hypothetical protein